MLLILSQIRPSFFLYIGKTLKTPLRLYLRLTGPYAISLYEN